MYDKGSTPQVVGLQLSGGCTTCDLIKVGVIFEDPYAEVTNLVIFLVGVIGVGIQDLYES
jgi:hypothetical protein